MQTLKEGKEVMKKEWYVVNSIYKYYPGKLENEEKPSTPQMNIVSGRNFRIETMKKSKQQGEENSFCLDLCILTVL